MSIIESIILGIIQGLTEFLPVSSSGHLVLIKALMDVDLESNLFMNVMLHLGTLVAVLVVYYKLIIRLVKEFVSLVKDIFTGKFKWREMNHDRNLIMMLIISLLPLFLLFMPLPFSGGITGKDMAEIFSSNDYLSVVAFSLLMTSTLLFLGIMANRNTVRASIEKNPNKPAAQAGRRRYKVIDAVAVGFAQLFAAIFPGLSRSGSTLAAAQLRGINRQEALDYSFILGVPSIFAAALLEIKDVFESSADPLAGTGIGAVLAGIVTAAIVGVAAIKLFKWMLSKDRMYIFVIYTAIVGLVTLVTSLIGTVK